MSLCNHESSGEFTLNDLELLHHYTTSACLTFSTDPMVRNFWRVNVPQIGFTTPYVLKGLLSLSALHLAKFRPERKDFYLAAALSQHNAAVSLVSRLILAITAENCVEHFLFSTITNYFAFGKPREPDTFLLTRQGALPEWLTLFRGVRAVMETEIDVIRRSPVRLCFHSDPSCIFVESWNQTFFCATSTFLAFPGIPIYARQDLQTWTLISSVFNRPSQLPALATEIAQTSGIWAPNIRYRGDTFYVTTTLVDDAKNISDTSRWDNVIFTTGNPYDSSSWSDPTHFNFDGYDPGLFWDDNGQAYVVGSHPWQIRPGIDLAPLNLETGEVGKQETV
ncbi:hypothetical protein INS49_009934 [Diaporthe citri]|uniref:uncharacterized protein n=1 Tax=Diaporthe citri TaxID=83186 RepID=UPI001C7EC4DB|nr:uncharacterized protein INS49_009934 [Diaporthe citri]KAG6361706.1 hypothetical protein INS49_009934 [Diaporthe citri]